MHTETFTFDSPQIPNRLHTKIVNSEVFATAIMKISQCQSDDELHELQNQIEPWMDMVGEVENNCSKYAFASALNFWNEKNVSSFFWDYSINNLIKLSKPSNYTKIQLGLEDTMASSHCNNNNIIIINLMTVRLPTQHTCITNLHVKVTGMERLQSPPKLVAAEQRPPNIRMKEEKKKKENQ